MGERKMMDHLNVSKLSALVVTLIIMITMISGVLVPVIASASSDPDVTPEISALLSTITFIVPIGVIYVYVTMFKDRD